MSDIGKPERQTQQRVIQLFQNDLGYQYLGDWTDRPGNSNIEDNLLTTFLQASGYNTAQASRVLEALHREADNTNRSLMANNQAVYKLLRYAFMAEHQSQFRLRSMCRVLRVQRSGYYAWKKKPNSKRTLADESLLVKIEKSFKESQSIYGSPKVHYDLREDGVLCGDKRIARLMHKAQLRSVRGYKRPRYRAGMLATTAPNRTTARIHRRPA